MTHTDYVMRNFDYLQDIDALRDLYRFCSAAEETQKTDYDTKVLGLIRIHHFLNCSSSSDWIK